MKRALLIVGGTVGGLGAVLSITPPQITSSSSVSSLPGAMPALGGAKQNAPTPTAKATQSSAPTTAATKKATPSAKASAQSSASATAAPAQSQSATATPVQTQAAASAPATKSGVSGTFTGSAVDVSYGIVQVKITVANGQITDAQAVQAPNGRNDRYTQMAVPILRQRTLAAQGANISGVSGASYTSYGWYTSLVSALKQAGL